MNYPIPRAATKTPSIETSQSIVNQGTIPLKNGSAVGVPPAPKGEQTARGFGAMLRPHKYTVS